MSSGAAPGSGSEGGAASARAVVAGHGDFAAGLVSAVAQISGRGEVFIPLSNRDRSAVEVERALREALAPGVRVVFTDLPAGSCTIAARRLQRERPDLLLVTGANLAALLEFALAEGDPSAGVERAVEKGRGSLAVASPPARPAAPAAPAGETPRGH